MHDAKTSVLSKAAILIMASTSKFLTEYSQDMNDTIITHTNAAYQPEMMRWLAHHGVPLEAFDSQYIAVVTGVDKIAETKITAAMFNQQSMPREGKSNPELSDVSTYGSK